MADHLVSEGARLERKALRAYLRRELKKTPADVALQNTLVWLLGRQKRYDKVEGGLGKK
jgi:hypothetical protein